jgi:hypothetical protein
MTWSDYTSANDKAPVEFSAATTTRNIVVPIDTARALIVYQGLDSKCYGRVASIDASGDVTYGDQAVIFNGFITDTAACLLDSTHAVVGFEDPGVGPKIVIATISGTSISAVGTPVNVASGKDVSDVNVCTVSTAQGLVAFRNVTDSKIQVVEFGVSGDVITAGNTTDIDASGGDTPTIDAVGGGKAIIAYDDAGNVPMAALISIGGTTPAVDDLINVRTASDVYGVRIIRRVEDGKAVLAYSNATTSKSMAVVLTASGSELSLGTPAEFSASAMTRRPGIAIPEAGYAVITYLDTGAIKTTVLEIDGAALTPLAAQTNLPATKDWIASREVGTEFVLAAYQDSSDSGKGKAIVLKKPSSGTDVAVNDVNVSVTVENCLLSINVGIDDVNVSVSIEDVACTVYSPPAPERIVTVSKDNRTVTIKAEGREYQVLPDNRTIEV